MCILAWKLLTARNARSGLRNSSERRTHPDFLGLEQIVNQQLPHPSLPPALRFPLATLPPESSAAARFSPFVPTHRLARKITILCENIFPQWRVRGRGSVPSCLVESLAYRQPNLPLSRGQ